MLTQQVKVWMCQYPLGKCSEVLCNLVKPCEWQDSTQMTSIVLTSVVLGMRLVLPVGCVLYVNLISSMLHVSMPCSCLQLYNGPRFT